MAPNRQPLTPLQFLERSAHVFPTQTAVVDHDRRFTYAEFFARAAALAAALKVAGIKPGDRVAFLAMNGEPLLAAHFGVPLCGAVLVAINTRLSREDVSYILNHAQATALFVDLTLFPNPTQLPSECPHLRTVVALGTEYEDFLSRGTDRQLSRELEDEDALISLNYTSGTTGYLKGVMYTHRGAYLNALGNAIEVGLTSETRYLWTLPMFHCNGWCYPWSVTAVGGVHICLERPRPDAVFRLVESERITHLCAAPTVLIDLAQYASMNRVALKIPLTVMTGGAAPAPQVIRNMEAIGVRVIHLYGLTETYGPSMICQWRTEWDSLPADQRATIKARQGVGDLMTEQRVVRQDGCDVEWNGEEIGEIVIRGNAVMKGYYRDELATEEAFRGGWFHTQDLAVVHPDGYAEVKDRAKDIIVSGGENISSLEVERVIYTHPAVLEVAVVPSPHERFGEVPQAFVVLKPGMELTADVLLDYCRERLAGFKCPKRIACVPNLPKTPTGKVQKYLLRDKPTSSSHGEPDVREGRVRVD